MLLMHTERWSVDVCTNPNYNLIVSSKTSKLVWSHLRQKSEIWVKFSLLITISHKQAALMVNLHKQGFVCVHFTFNFSLNQIIRDRIFSWWNSRWTKKLFIGRKLTSHELLQLWLFMKFEKLQRPMVMWRLKAVRGAAPLVAWFTVWPPQYRHRRGATHVIVCHGSHLQPHLSTLAWPGGLLLDLVRATPEIPASA